MDERLAESADRSQFLRLYGLAMTAKTRTDLAVLGGQPAFLEELHVGRPNIGHRDKLFKRLGDLLDRKWLTNQGPLVEEFEQRLAKYLGVRHCITTCNATVGLLIAARAVGLSGEVIIPSFTFVATAHALRWNGIKPVFCDVDARTHTLDPVKVEELVNSRTTGIVGVHLWGRPCAVDALGSIARRHRLELLFDAAHAFGCTVDGRMVGRFGTAEVFSFHATKVLNSFEGGAITTGDDAIAAKIRLMINSGFADYDKVVSIGINGKMSEPAAAMGLTSLESVDGFVAHNKEMYRRYHEQLGGVAGVEVLRVAENERHNYHYIVLTVGEGAGLTRDELQRVLWAEGVRARRYFHPGCHRMEPYRAADPDVGRRLPVTERLSAQVLCLPTGTAVNRADVDAVCEIIRTALTRRAEVRAALANPSHALAWSVAGRA